MNLTCQDCGPKHAALFNPSQRTKPEGHVRRCIACQTKYSRLAKDKFRLKPDPKNSWRQGLYLPGSKASPDFVQGK